MAACVATGSWALAEAFDRVLPDRIPMLTSALDGSRLLAWVVFLGIARRVGRGSPPGWSGRASRSTAGAILTLSLLAHEVAGAPPDGYGSLPFFYARLAIAVAGLAMTEALFREARAEGLWRIRYLCLAAGAMLVLVYDLFVWSDALLFHCLDPELAASRSAVSLIAAPLVGLAAARNAAWSTDFAIARVAVLHGMVLVSVGIYLVGLSAVGVLLRRNGGAWGGFLSPALALGGLVLLELLASSPSVRRRLRRAFGRYLFTHRHDYREQWHRFSAALAPRESLAARALGALAHVVGSTRGGLWWREPEGFTRLADLGLRDAAPAAFASDSFATGLERNGAAIVELGGGEGSVETARREWLPEWMRRRRGALLLVPLAVGDRVVGFATLSGPPGAQALALEDEELLRWAALHAASYLAAEHTARQLEDARHFEELSRRFAFIAHDLRNLTHELTLSLANARRHIARPEFQRDLLLSMEESVARMQRLLDRLAESKPAPPAIAATDLRALVVRSFGGWTGVPPVRLDLEGDEALVVACDPDRLVSMSGHLVRNAIEAAGPDGRVTVRVRRAGGAGVFEVEDDGPGMTPEFLRERLRRPFRSSKRSGFGLGLHECRELARQVGGDLAIDSEPGRGTVARLRLPFARGQDVASSEAIDGGA